jgi:hypothetical protein
VAAGDRPVTARRVVTASYAILGALAAWAGAIGAIAIRIVDPVPQLPSTFGFGDTALAGFALLGVAFASVGALLVVRRPDNIIGGLMVVIGDGYAIGIFWAAVTFSLAAHPLAVPWLSVPVAGWLTVLFTSIGGLVFALGFIFPTGRGQTPAWDRALKVAAILTPFIFVILFLIRPGALHVFPTIDNPFGFGPDPRPWLGDHVSERLSAMTVIIFPLVVWSIVARYRMDDPIERQQIKWVGLATALTIASLVVAGVGASLSDRPPEIGLVMFGFGGTLIPVAIGVAILRYHLYDIDRVISRTLGYAVITGVLAAVFVAVVLVLTAVLSRFAEGETIAIAASTLVVFSLFQPLRRRIQRAVDRRFDRARYDSERTVAAFAERLRGEVDLANVNANLATTIRTAIAPASVAVWLRARRTDR